MPPQVRMPEQPPWGPPGSPRRAAWSLPWRASPAWLQPWLLAPSVPVTWLPPALRLRLPWAPGPWRPRASVQAWLQQAWLQQAWLQRAWLQRAWLQRAWLQRAWLQRAWLQRAWWRAAWPPSLPAWQQAWSPVPPCGRQFGARVSCQKERGLTCWWVCVGRRPCRGNRTEKYTRKRCF
ncbi:MAG: hypothetical protein ACKOCF_09425 [Gammaproteobacteria bacterium]